MAAVSPDPVAVVPQIRNEPLVGLFVHKQHTSYGASSWIISDACIALGVRPAGLARLLGLPYYSSIYRWIGGQHRPSQVYAMRLVRLLLMDLKGYQVKRLHSIDWETGNMVYQEGVDLDKIREGVLAAREGG